MRIGYACKTMGVPGLEQRTCSMKNATPDKLRELIAHNLDVLERILDYNRAHGITLFRISSDIIPFGSSPANTLDWAGEFGDKLAEIGRRAAGTRLSMHPGQYTVLNSPNPQVVANAVADLEYHCAFLDSLGLDTTHKLILHIGGAYGDRDAAKARFVENYARLSGRVKRRLIIENDDRIFHIEDLLELSDRTGAPVVFDLLHHRINPPPTGREDGQWIALCAETWAKEDGIPKLHYSQQAPGRKPGSHSDTILAAPFLDFLGEAGNADVMLEVKDKNLSAVKCLNCLHPNMKSLEQEWSRYKYAVLEYSQRDYRTIRQLLRDKSAAPTLEFYTLVEGALAGERQNVRDGAEHVWGHLKDRATPAEKTRFFSLLEQHLTGDMPLERVKNHLRRLAEKYGERYLLHSYYFLY